jgi:iron complex outermembrane receptor protein
MVILRFVLSAIFCLIVAFGGASPAAAQGEAVAPAADSQETEVEGESDPEDGSEDEAAVDSEDGDEGEAAVESEEGDEGESPVARSQQDDVEDLYVTATKREESLQDVPISMSALNAEFLEDSGLTSFGQLQEYVPNLTINPVTDTRGTVIRIRGIGSAGSNAGIDPSVGVFIDGIYQGRAGMSVGDLLDIERVEVLRGPQGTLYGKNTAAGLINIISKRPVYEWESIVEGVFGNYDNYEVRASVNAPILDEHLAARFSGYGVWRDGFDKRLNLGGRSDPPFYGTPPDFDDRDDAFVFQDGRVNDAGKWGVKGRLLWDVTDSLSFLVSGDYSKEDTICCVADILSYEGAPTLWHRLTFTGMPRPADPALKFPSLESITGVPPTEGAFDNVVTANQEPYNLVEIGGVSLDGSYELPDMPVLGGSVVNLIGSWRTYISDSQFDGDFSYYDAVLAWTEVDLDQYSAELRFTSPGAQLVDYQVGGYFYHQDMDTLDRNGFEWDFLELWPLADEPVMNIGDNNHKTWSYAAFGQATLNPIERLSLTGGVRYTYEKKTREGTQVSTFPPCDPAQGWDPDGPNLTCLDVPPIMGPPVGKDEKRSVSNVSWMTNLRYFPTEEIMLYASVATGFKSGGFNQLRTSAAAPSEFADEESTNYEFGFKTSWFERMLTFNSTGFYTEYKNFQAQVFDGSSINVINAGELLSYGVEADLVVVPLPGLVIGSSLGFNIAEYDSFDLGPQTARQKWEVTKDPYLPRDPTDPDPPLIPNPAYPDVLGSPPKCGAPYDTWPSGQRKYPWLDLEACVQDLGGERLNNAPRWSVSSFAQYEYPLPWYPIELFGRAEYAYTSMVYLDVDLDPAMKQAATHIVNLRAGFRGELRWGEWEVTGWVRNLTGEGYNVVGFDVPTINGFAGVNGPPRQYGLTVRVTL